MADIFFALVLSSLAIFLILLVLVQRGRGGGLAGALGGMGGSSAFGAKAGDVFTRITIITAAVWIVICLIAVFWAKHGGDAFSGTNPNALPVRPEPPLNAPAGNAPGDAGATAPTGSPGGGAGTTAPAATGAQSASETPAAASDATPPAESAPDGAGNSGGALPPAENQ